MRWETGFTWGKRALVGLAVARALATATATPAEQAPNAPTVHSDVPYADRQAKPLLADVYVPSGDGPFPAVLCIHGGAWRFGSKERMKRIALELAENGYTAVAINYRLAPKHVFPAQRDDCWAALRWMRDKAKAYRIDPTRIGVFGYSAGGHLAALLGVTEPPRAKSNGANKPANGDGDAAAGKDLRPRAVVAGGAPCDFRSVPADERWFVYFLGGTRREKPDLYRSASPAAFVSADDPPFFFYHGELDFMVPFAGAQEVAEALDKQGVETKVYVVPGKGHIGAFLDKQARQEAIKFLDKHLKK